MGSGNEDQIKPDPSTSAAPPFLKTLLAGPIAGVCSRVFTYPADTIKAQLQVQGTLQGTNQYATTFDAVRQVAKAEGLQGFYRGFPVVALGNIPANMAYFAGYELGKAVVPGDYGMLSDMGVGALAQLCGGVMFTPVDIIKERMQVQSLMKGRVWYKGSFDALKALLRDQGPLGLLRGFWATNAVWIPWNIMYIAAYEESKRAAARMMPALSTGPATTSVQSSISSSNSSSSEPQLPPWVVGLCSAGAASLAAVLTHPADVVKTRLQVLSALPGGHSLTAWSVAKSTLQAEGAKAFLTGATARILTLAPGTALSWMVYEPVKAAIDTWL